MTPILRVTQGISIPVRLLLEKPVAVAQAHRQWRQGRVKVELRLEADSTMATMDTVNLRGLQIQAIHRPVRGGEHHRRVAQASVVQTYHHQATRHRLSRLCQMTSSVSSGTAQAQAKTLA
jgi:hypothetical protein